MGRGPRRTPRRLLAVGAPRGLLPSRRGPLPGAQPLSRRPAVPDATYVTPPPAVAGCGYGARMGNDTAGTGAATTRGAGYALLLPAGPMGKQRLMDAAAALPQLAAVPPAALLGTPGGASVVQLVDPADPQTVLTHLRTAAAHPGPVLIYLAGQL